VDTVVTMTTALALNIRHGRGKRIARHAGSRRSSPTTVDVAIADRAILLIARVGDQDGRACRIRRRHFRQSLKVLRRVTSVEPVTTDVPSVRNSVRETIETVRPTRTKNQCRSAPGEQSGRGPPRCRCWRR